jgi:hypothetical protein
VPDLHLTAVSIGLLMPFVQPPAAHNFSFLLLLRSCCNAVLPQLAFSSLLPLSLHMPFSARGIVKELFVGAVSLATIHRYPWFQITRELSFGSLCAASICMLSWDLF